MKKQQTKQTQTKKEIKSEAIVTSVAAEKGYVRFIQLAIIILLGVIIYSNSFNCSFHLDDVNNFIDNKKIPALTDFNGWWNFNKSRLIAFYSLALNNHYNQFDVWGYHLVNLLIHLINACLVWWLTRMIFSAPAIKNHPLAKYKSELALIAALFFVSHPLATQSVTYIVQRMASMVAMFYLMSVACYLKARLANASGTRYLFFVAAFLFAILAMFTKENAFTLPFAILLVEFFLIRTKKFEFNFKDYRLLLGLVGMIAFIAIVAMKFSFGIFKTIPANEVNAAPLTPVSYLLTQFRVIAEYIRLLVLPVNQMVDYDMPVAASFFEARVLLSFLIHAGLIALALYLFNRNRLISFGIFWFYLTLSVESGIIPINDVIFEHRTYLPSFGFFLILSFLIYNSLRENSRMIAFALVAVMTCAYSVLTFQRNKVWKDDITLWSDNIKKAPEKPRPLYCRGFGYSALQQWDKAITDYTKAISLFPRYTFAYSNRGVAYAKLKQYDKAVADYSKAIEFDSDYEIAYFNRGANYGELGQWELAIADYTKAIEFNPKYVDAYSNRGIAYTKLLQWEKGIEDYSKAIEINPNHPKAYYNRALAYGSMNEWEKAIADYTTAIAKNPKYLNAYNNRAAASEQLGKFENAIEDYKAALRIDPNFTTAKNNLERLERSR